MFVGARSFRFGLLAGLAALASPAILAGQTPLSPEQVVTLQSVGSVALSPDGRLIAYTMAQPRDSAEDRGGSYSELYVVSADGGAPRAILTKPRSAAQPRWSPDGRMLAFMALLPGHDQRQVWAVPAAGGEPVRLTGSTSDVSSFEWAPTGDAIAYTAPGPRRSPARPAANDVIVMSEQGRFSRLFVQSLAAGAMGPQGTPRALTPENLNVAAIAWAPDARTLAIQTTEELGADADLMYRRLQVVAAAGGAPRVLAATEGKLGPMAWSPDGAMLAWIGATAFNDPIAQSVFVVAAAGGETRNLTPGIEATATGITWLGAQTVAFVAAEGTRTTLNRVAAAGGAVERIAGGGAEIFADASFDARGRSFAVAANTARHPGEVFVGQLATGRTRTPAALRRVTTHNAWLANVALGEQRTIEWTGPDDLRIEGVVILPAGYQQGGRYPLAILPHGGPEGISQDGWTTNPLYPAQVLAGRGYVVLMPNYRGSGGRGVAFSKADHRDLGGEEFDDVLAGIDHLAAQGIVDANRVGISGTSYGGYFSAWAATRHSDRFKVAIPFAGLTNWQAFTLTTDIPVEMSAVHWDLHPWNQHAGTYWERSPVAHIDKANTPTLIGHDLADDRVHPEQSLELYQALKLKGVTVDLVQYPREPHGLRERAHQLDYMRRIIEWLDRYLKERTT